MWIFSISVSHFILNQLPQKEMYLLCTTVPSFFHLTHQMEQEPEIQTSCTKHGGGRLSGQNINKSTHTH